MNIFQSAMDPYFMKYLAAAGAILAVAGAILVALRAAGLKENKIVAHSWKAYCSWLAMAAVIFGVLALGRAAFVFGMLLLSIFCIREFAMATGLYADKWFMSVIYANVTAIYWCVSTGWYGCSSSCRCLASACFSWCRYSGTKHPACCRKSA